MSTQIENAQTNVQQVDLDIDSLFDGAPVAENIITPSENSSTPSSKKNNIFSKNNVDLSFLDPDSEESKTDD